MTKDKKISYKLLGSHTDEAGKIFPRGSVVTLTLEEAKQACYENKLVRIIDESESNIVLDKVTAQASKQAEKILEEAKKQAELIIKKAEAEAKKAGKEKPTKVANVEPKTVEPETEG